jgi:hypothetical protein
LQGGVVNRENSTDEKTGMRYSPIMPATKTRPTILFPRRRSPHRKAIAKAVQELADLRKNDPTAYRELIKKYEGQTVRIVPG